MSEETIPQMRERIETLEKANKALEKSNSDLLSTNREFQAREVARDQGFSPNVGNLFAKVNDGDITAEALTSFASENGLQPVQATTEAEEETSESSDDSGASDDRSGLASMSGGSSTAGTGGQQSTGGKALTRQEYNDLQQSDPVAARQAVMEGRVQLRADNPLAVRR